LAYTPMLTFGILIKGGPQTTSLCPTSTDCTSKWRTDTRPTLSSMSIRVTGPRLSLTRLAPMTSNDSLFQRAPLEDFSSWVVEYSGNSRPELEPNSCVECGAWLRRTSPPTRVSKFLGDAGMGF
jgi:hypothetical protein